MPTIKSYHYQSGDGLTPTPTLTLTLSVSSLAQSMLTLQQIRDTVDDGGRYVAATRDAVDEFAEAVAKVAPKKAPDDYGDDDMARASEVVVTAPEPEPEPEPEPKPKRPGMDPAAALAAYDDQHGGEKAASSTEAAPADRFAVGGRYDGVEIKRVQVSNAQGFGVLTLAHGGRVQYNLESGHEIARKGFPSGPVDDIAPTSRQSGPGAPKIDEPIEVDATSTAAEVDAPETSDDFGRVVEAETLKGAVHAALRFVPADRLVEWATKVRLDVPAFKRVQASRFPDRVARQVAKLTPAEGGA